MKMGQTVDLLKLRAREAIDDMDAKLVSGLASMRRSLPRRSRALRSVLDSCCAAWTLAQELRLESDDVMIDPMSLNDYPLIAGQKLVKVKVSLL
jgi:hypothetical protein